MYASRIYGRLPGALRTELGRCRCRCQEACGLFSGCGSHARQRGGAPWRTPQERHRGCLRPRQVGDTHKRHRQRQWQRPTRVHRRQAGGCGRYGHSARGCAEGLFRASLSSCLQSELLSPSHTRGGRCYRERHSDAPQRRVRPQARQKIQDPYGGARPRRFLIESGRRARRFPERCFARCAGVVLQDVARGGQRLRKARRCLYPRMDQRA